MECNIQISSPNVGVSTWRWSQLLTFKLQDFWMCAMSLIWNSTVITTYLCSNSSTRCCRTTLWLSLLKTNSQPVFLFSSSVSISRTYTHKGIIIKANNNKWRTTYNAKQNTVLGMIVWHAEHRSPVASVNHTHTNYYAAKKKSKHLMQIHCPVSTPVSLLHFSCKMQWCNE